MGIEKLTFAQATVILEHFYKCFHGKEWCVGGCRNCPYDWTNSKLKRAITKYIDTYEQYQLACPPVFKKFLRCDMHIQVCEVKCYKCRCAYTDSELAEGIKLALVDSNWLNHCIKLGVEE